MQTFVWLADGALALNSLVAATPTRFDRLPAVSNLLGAGDGASLAQRLGEAHTRSRLRESHSACSALKTGRSFVVSCNLPAETLVRASDPQLFAADNSRSLSPRSMCCSCCSTHAHQIEFS